MTSKTVSSSNPSFYGIRLRSLTTQGPGVSSKERLSLNHLFPLEIVAHLQLFLNPGIPFCKGSVLTSLLLPLNQEYLTTSSYSAFLFFFRLDKIITVAPFDKVTLSKTFTWTAVPSHRLTWTTVPSLPSSCRYLLFQIYVMLSWIWSQISPTLPAVYLHVPDTYISFVVSQGDAWRGAGEPGAAGGLEPLSTDGHRDRIQGAHPALHFNTLLLRVDGGRTPFPAAARPAVHY